MFLDSNHAKTHVRTELEAYHPLLTRGSYMVASEGVMRDIHNVPTGSAQWTWNNSMEATVEFSVSCPEFTVEETPRIFDESQLAEVVTYWPGAWLSRRGG